MDYPRLFIEEIMPVLLLNEQVYYEHGGNPFKGLHRWYSRKPLSFSRASVLASLLPGDVSMEEFLYLLGLFPEREGLKPDPGLRLYKTPPGPLRIKRVHELCEGVWGGVPVVLDGFAGGGSIPFEAARYGLRVFASDLNPVAVVTMKAAMEFPLRFGPDLQVDIDKWVKWVGDKAEERLGEFFPVGGNPPQPPFSRGGQEKVPLEKGDLGGFSVLHNGEGNPPQPPFSRGGQEEVPLEKGDLGGFSSPQTNYKQRQKSNITIQNYLWAHTVECPGCRSTVPLSPNWWLSRTSNYAGKGQARKVTSNWYAVKPIPNPEEKRVDFELIKGPKGKGTTIKTESGDFNPDDYSTMGRGVGKCPNCGTIIENEYITSLNQKSKLGHQLYAIAYKKGKGSLEFKIPEQLDLDAVQKATLKVAEKHNSVLEYFPTEEVPPVTRDSRLRLYGMEQWMDLFNPRQLLTLVTYVEIINEAKAQIREACEAEKQAKLATIQNNPDAIAELEEHYQKKVEAIVTYLAMVMDRCVDTNCRLSGWHSSRSAVDRASKTHALNLTWNYPETNGSCELWASCANVFAVDYKVLCDLIGVTDQTLFSSQVGGNPPQPPFSRGEHPEVPLEKGDLGGFSIPHNGEENPPQPPFSRGEYPEVPLEKGDLGGYNPALAAQIQAMAKQRNLTYNRGFLPYNRKLAERAKALRKNMTPAEKKLWNEFLRSLSDRVLRQKPLDHFIVDFYCPARHLVIEVDGDSHFTEDGQAYDAERTQILEQYGLTVLRFTNDEVLDNFEGVCQVIENSPRPPFLRGEEEQNDEVFLREEYPEVPLEKGDLGGFSIPHNGEGNPPQPPFLRREEEQNDEVFLREEYPEVPLEKGDLGGFPPLCNITSASADSLFHIEDQSIDAIITDPPYYGTIQYAELSDFFYVWERRILDDIFPELFLTELTDKDREAVANPSRFRNMGISPDELANQDYEAKMQMAFQEYHRVLRDDGVMTVQFNHKDSGAWDTLAQSLIQAGFTITASWAVNTENPQNLHQAKKNSVSSTVLLICRKRNPNAGQAWWDDLRPQLANLVEKRAPHYEANNITGINLYLSAFGPALNIFTQHHPILNSNGQEVRPEQAFAQARIAIANYRFRKLVQTETTGFDPLTQWYLLAWDAFNAREFPFDEARQLALAIGGFNVTDLAKTHKLIDSTSGTCKLLTPQQRLKKRAFTLNATEFTPHTLIDSLHALLALYSEEQTLPPVRRFLKDTGLITNDLLMKTLEIAFKVLPQNTPEYQNLLNLWLNLEELKTKVIVEQLQIDYTPEGQLNLFPDQP